MSKNNSISGKLSFRNADEIKTFSDDQKLRDFVNNKSV